MLFSTEIGQKPCSLFKANLPSWIYSNAGAVAKMASLFINLFRMSAHPSLHAIWNWVPTKLKILIFHWLACNRISWFKTQRWNHKNVLIIIIYSSLNWIYLHLKRTFSTCKEGAGLYGIFLYSILGLYLYFIKAFKFWQFPGWPQLLKMFWYKYFESEETLPPIWDGTRIKAS